MCCWEHRCVALCVDWNLQTADKWGWFRVSRWSISSCLKIGLDRWAAASSHLLFQPLLSHFLSSVTLILSRLQTEYAHQRTRHLVVSWYEGIRTLWRLCSRWWKRFVFKDWCLICFAALNHFRCHLIYLPWLQTQFESTSLFIPLKQIQQVPCG